MRSLSLWIVIAFFLLGLTSVTAGVQGFDRRQEELDPATTADPTRLGSGADTIQTEQATGTSTVTATEATVATTGTTTGGTSTSTAESDATTTGPEGPSATSGDGAGVEPDPDALPLEPKISPALAITGVVLIITGIVHTLIGIKKRWTQVFLSTSFLAGLSVAVLIVYVMNTPVPDARQGGYFVACFLTAVIFGAVSLVFQEITEGMGCLLGGFCLSMWLLALKPGGLLTETSSKVAFIAAFTVAAYATSFTHYTRPYGLIGSTSFAGATATILGIDCFSRAGLKEFWLYIWGLNPDIFPLNTTTYPISRGIRVELAGIVVTCFIGIISQVKLWKVINERRKAKLAAKADEEQQRDKEEEEAGRNLEEANSREMAVWQATYEDGDKQKADSGIGGSDSTIGKQDLDRTPSVSRTDPGAVAVPGDDLGETKSVDSPGERSSIWGFPKKKESVSGNPDADDVLSSEDGTCEVYAGSRDVRGTSTPNRMSNMSTAASIVMTTFPQSPRGARTSSGAQRARPLSGDQLPIEGPTVTPLPFPIPLGSASKREDDELSVAASAGSDVDMNEFSRRFSRLSNFTRLSRLFEDNSSSENDGCPSISLADLSQPAPDADGDGENPSSSPRGLKPDDNPYDLKASTPNSVGDDCERATDPQDFTAAVSQGLTKCERQATDDETRRSSINILMDAGSETKNALTSPLPSPPLLTVPGMEPERKVEGSAVSETTPHETGTSPSGVRRSESIARSTISRTSSLTAGAVEMLPSQTSSVTMSYRTNEWAKHLSRADVPAVEPIKQPTFEGDDKNVSLQEDPVVPVNVVQLQQTALDARPPPVIEHHAPAAHGLEDPNIPRPALTVSAIGSEEENAQQDLPIQSSASSRHLRPASQYIQNKGYSTPNSLHSMLDGSSGQNFPRNSQTPFMSNSVHGSVIQETSEWESSGNGEDSPGAPPPLMAMRESMIRNRISSPFLSRNSSVPSLAKSQQSFTDNPVGPIGNASRQSLVAPDDDMPLAQRRELMRQQSLSRAEPTSFSYPNSINSYDHPPRPGARSPLSASPRQAPNPEILREANLAAWRESIREEIAMEHVPQTTVENRRADMLMEKRQTTRGKQQETMLAQYRDQALTEAMQRGDMQHLHREAMRKMQAQANQRT